MDHVNDDWLSKFSHEEVESDWSMYSDPQIYAMFQDTTTTLDSNTQHAQTHGSASLPWSDTPRVVANPTQALQAARTEAYSYTQHVAAPYQRMDTVASKAPIQDHVTASTYNQAFSDTPSTPQVSVETPYDLEAVCSIHRRKGSDEMSFRCLMTGCYKSHSRWPDFLRHYNGAHAAEKKSFWCPKDGCVRSKADGSNPFSRKDKMKDHLRQAHDNRRSL